jgi:hypothetical protein
MTNEPGRINPNIVRALAILCIIIATFIFFQNKKSATQDAISIPTVPTVLVNNQVYTLNELTPEIIKNCITSERTSKFGAAYTDSVLNVRFDANSVQMKNRITELYIKAFPDRTFSWYRLFQDITINPPFFEFAITYENNQ